MGGGLEYTSARMNSLSAFTYGRLEFRARLPGADGLWAALWMLPLTGPRSAPGDGAYGSWPKSGEIDVMEYAPGGPYGNRVLGTVHTGTYNSLKGSQQGHYIHINRLTSEFQS